MRIGTLFSGIGAPEQGAKRVYGDDLELIFACEYDKFARQSFNENYEIHPDHFHNDVTVEKWKYWSGVVHVQALALQGKETGRMTLVESSSTNT